MCVLFLTSMITITLLPSTVSFTPRKAKNKKYEGEDKLIQQHQTSVISSYKVEVTGYEDSNIILVSIYH